MPLEAWKRERALTVAWPKYWVSFPGEPGPDKETWKPWEFKYFWRRMTSEPVEPRVRSRVNEPVVAIAGTAAAVQTWAVFPPESELTLAMVMGPKYPTAGEILFATWYLINAAVVAGPKYVDSLPGEPMPARETWKPWVFRNCWRDLTSEPVAPIVMERVKETDETVVQEDPVTVFEAVETDWMPDTPPDKDEPAGLPPDETLPTETEPPSPDEPLPPDDPPPDEAEAVVNWLSPDVVVLPDESVD
jgi:hypothetical protein